MNFEVGKLRSKRGSPQAVNKERAKKMEEEVRFTHIVHDVPTTQKKGGGEKMTQFISSLLLRY
jgi:hypothetical protein